MTYLLPFRLPSCNEYIDACRKNKYAGAAMKKRCEDMIAPFLKGHYEGDVRVSIDWHEPNKRRDVDNVVFGKKFIFDALQKKGVLNNDKQITEITDKVYYGDTKIVVQIEEINQSDKQLEGQLSMEEVLKNGVSKRKRQRITHSGVLNVDKC